MWKSEGLRTPGEHGPLNQISRAHMVLGTEAASTALDVMAVSLVFLLDPYSGTVTDSFA